MAFQFGSESRRRRILIVLGLLLAVLAAVGAFALTNRPAPAPTVEAKSKVLVAAAPILARTAVQPGDVVVRDIATSAVVPGAFTEPGQVVGLLTAVSILQGQQITPNLFGTAGDIDFSILAPDETVQPDSPYWRAASVTVPSDRAVGGKLHTGQHIDLIANIQLRVGQVDPITLEFVELPVDGRYITGTTTKITFEDVTILLAEEDSDVYILKVDLHQAEQLALIQADATNTFNIVLRPDADMRVIDRALFGETVDRIIVRYRYLIPEILDIFQFIPNPPVPGAGSPGPIPTLPPGQSAPPGPVETPAGSPSP